MVLWIEFLGLIVYNDGGVYLTTASGSDFTDDAENTLRLGFQYNGVIYHFPLGDDPIGGPRDEPYS